MLCGTASTSRSPSSFSFFPASPSPPPVPWRRPCWRGAPERASNPSRLRRNPRLGGKRRELGAEHRVHPHPRGLRRVHVLPALGIFPPVEIQNGQVVVRLAEIRLQDQCLAELFPGLVEALQLHQGRPQQEMDYGVEGGLRRRLGKTLLALQLLQPDRLLLDPADIRGPLTAPQVGDALPQKVHALLQPPLALHLLRMPQSLEVGERLPGGLVALQSLGEIAALHGNAAQLDVGFDQLREYLDGFLQLRLGFGVTLPGKELHPLIEVGARQHELVRIVRLGGGPGGRQEEQADDSQANGAVVHDELPEGQNSFFREFYHAGWIRHPPFCSASDSAKSEKLGIVIVPPWVL